MKRIPIDMAEPGMILAQKLVREDGVLLAQQGAEITEPLLRMLQRLNFETVPIEEASLETPEERAERIKREELALEERFSKVVDDPVLAALKNALLQRLHGDE